MSRALLVSVCTLCLAATVAHAVPTDIDWQDGRQDPLRLPFFVHELGANPPGAQVFPDEELITVDWEEPTEEIACQENYDPAGPGSWLLAITNQTPTFWTDLHYVADLETIITNDDGWVNGGLAFRIDNLGVNTPLVFESMAPDLVFEPQEQWIFIVQNYGNQPGGPVGALDSIGVGAMSPLFPPSTGSIIAVPEPVTLSLLAAGGLALVARQRKR